MDLSLPLPDRTIYSSVAMQLYMTHTVKNPTLKAVATIFDNKANKIQKLRAIKELWKVFEALKGLPEPTKENTWHPNTHHLIDLRDWIKRKCQLSLLRIGLIERVINFIIILYDFDPPWRWIFDSLWEEARAKEWKPKGWNDNWAKTYAWWSYT